MIESGEIQADTEEELEALAFTELVDCAAKYGYGKQKKSNDTTLISN